MAEKENDAKVPQDVRGEVKEKVGKAIGDKDLERQGRADQAKADLKDAAEEARSGVDEAIDKVRSSAEEAAEKAKQAFKE